MAERIFDAIGTGLGAAMLVALVYGLSESAFGPTIALAITSAAVGIAAGFYAFRASSPSSEEG